MLFIFLFLVALGLRFHETALVVSVEFFHGRADIVCSQLWSSCSEIRSLVVCDGLEEKRKTLTKRATATIARSSTKDEHQPESNMLDKCVMKNLLAEETRLQMAGSQEHLCSWYPKCVEGADVTESITETLALFLIMWRRALDVHRRLSKAQKKTKAKILGNSQIILLCILRRDIIKAGQDKKDILFI